MPLVEWSNSYSVRNDQIDDQHKRLFGYLNELSDAMSEGKGSAVVSKVLDSLISYTASHFSHEEKLFDKYNYPDTEEHKLIHAGFVEEVVKFKEEFEAGRALLSVKILKFLTAWLKEHIKGTDQKYSDFFEEKGWR